MYKLVFDKKALHFLNNIESEVKKRIWNKLQECKSNPFRYLKALSQINSFKLRIGDYRVIIDVDKKIKVLNILKIGHRKNVYS